MTLTIVESFQLGRRRQPGGGEDVVLTSPHFIGVADGATAKSDRRYDGDLSSGAFAVALLQDALQSLPPTATMPEAVAHCTAHFQAYYARKQIVAELAHAPYQRPCCSFILLSAARREVWALGDCQVRLGDQVFAHEKPIDQVLAAARAVALEIAVMDGTPLAALQKMDPDPGRAAILPMLRGQSHLQNADPTRSPFAFGVLDGFPVPAPFLLVHPVPPEVTEVVFGTDGYPILAPTLEASEAALAQYLAADPLCFRYLRRTKGCRLGDASFDDRAYVRVRL